MMKQEEFFKLFRLSEDSGGQNSLISAAWNEATLEERSRCMNIAFSVACDYGDSDAINACQSIAEQIEKP